MKKIVIHRQPEAKLVFENFPKEIKAKLQNLRELIFETAQEIEEIEEIEETTKWGELSYVVKKGSTIRINYNRKNPNQYAMYFSCTSKLVSTFKEIFVKVFTYEKNRAILFDIYEEIPKNELKGCITMALMYHRIKHIPNLGN